MLGTPATCGGEGRGVECHHAQHPPKPAECQRYPSLGQLGGQGSVAPSQEHNRGSAAPRGTERRAEGDGGRELRSHKVPEEDGDKQPLTPKRPLHLHNSMHNEHNYPYHSLKGELNPSAPGPCSLPLTLTASPPGKLTPSYA